MRDFLFAQTSFVNLEKHSFLVVLYGFLHSLCKPVCKLKSRLKVILYRKFILLNKDLLECSYIVLKVFFIRDKNNVISLNYGTTESNFVP